MRKILCAGGFLFLMPAAYTQSSFLLNAGSLSRNPLSVISLAEQPASLLSNRSLTLGIGGEKTFLVSGYGQYTIALALPEGKNSFGLSAFYGGSVLLHKTNLSLNYARRLGDKLGLALQFNYSSLSLPDNYGKGAAVFSRLGISLQLTPQLKTAFHISDPFGSSSLKNGEWIHRPDYSVGLGYEPSEKFYAGILFQKQESSDPQLFIDLVYNPLSYLRVHGGINAADASSWIGVCWFQRHFQFGLIVSMHQQLGLSPVSHLQFQQRKNQLP